MPLSLQGLYQGDCSIFKEKTIYKNKRKIEKCQMSCIFCRTNIEIEVFVGFQTPSVEVAS